MPLHPYTSTPLHPYAPPRRVADVSSHDFSCWHLARTFGADSWRGLLPSSVFPPSSPAQHLIGSPAACAAAFALVPATLAPSPTQLPPSRLAPAPRNQQASNVSLF